MFELSENQVEFVDLAEIGVQIENKYEESFKSINKDQELKITKINYDNIWN